jgi:hypothetical protein
MVGSRTALVQRLSSAVLTILIGLPTLQIPAQGFAPAVLNTEINSTMSCVGCCGSNCRCSGDCCGDAHIQTTTVRPLRWSAAEHITRNRDCQKNGWLLPTVTTSFQPWSDAPRFRQLTPLLRLFRKSTGVVCRWRHPAVSRSNPRAPPMVGPSPVDRFIG